jgi:hypothetical protein
MNKLTDHLLPILQHVQKYAAEAQGLGTFGLSFIGLASGMLGGIIGMLEHSPITIPVPGQPVTPPQA